MTTNLVGPSLLKVLESAVPFHNMGLVDSRTPSTLTFLDSARFLAPLLGNPNIVGVITDTTLAETLAVSRPDVVVHLADEPRFAFYTAYNERARQANLQLEPSRIDSSARIHERAYVAPYGVVIGSEVLIEPMATVLAGVRVGAHSIIRAGSSLGVEGFEHKRVAAGLLAVVHDGFVEIDEYVEIGANNTVARGLMGVNTRIGAHTKTDCLVHIAHCAQIGKRCLIPAAAMIAGSAVIGDDVWIGPNASISSQVCIGRGASVTIGSVVVRDVPEDGHVSGNFAVPHLEFLKQLRNQRAQGQSSVVERRASGSLYT
jgi:UDP-3-O-[3-hydroxymyristoyl] glucosamine N-acyltransferase LpxD